MIKNANDFNIAIQELSDIPAAADKFIGRQMSSSEYNLIMERIEKTLNTLYENTRVLDDIGAYCEEYVVKIVDDKRKAFIEKLKVIEDLTDSYQDKNYITTIVPFGNTQEAIRDRAGNIISSLVQNNGHMEMAGEVIAEARMANVEMNTSHSCKESSFLDLVTAGKSRSSYVAYEPVSGGIRETYQIMFKEPLDVNYVDIKPINCKMENLQLLKDTLVTGIKFDLVCSNYTNILLSDKNSSIDSLLAKPYNRSSNIFSFDKIEERVSDVERLAAQGLYRGKYASWEQSSNSIDEKNLISSGAQATSYASSHDNRSIDSKAIVCSDGSIIETLSSTGFQYTPSNEVNKKEMPLNDNYKKEDKPDFIPGATGSNKYGYGYFFGIDSIKIQKKAIKNVCGYISTPISIKNSYIELSAIAADLSPFEFSIVDGTVETPILPVDITEIINEPLFFGSPVRFEIDKTKPVTIKKNSVATNLSVNDISSIDFSAGEYTISYTPILNRKYFPQGSEIKVKIIQRKTEQQINLEEIIIKKYGGDIAWNI